MNDLKILVTGCAGYIGVPICQALLDVGCKVTGIDSFWHENHSAVLGLLGHKNFTLIEGDVLPLVQLSKPYTHADVVVPLAALVGAPVCDKHPYLASAVNYEAVRHLATSLSPAQRILLPNTNSGYGSPHGEVTEDCPMAPLSHYARTKCEAEKAVLNRPNSVSLRLATVFGCAPRMRMDLLVNDWTEQLATGRPFTVYEPHFRRNFVHVRDVARAFVWAIVHPEMAGPYNVALPAANLTKMELAQTICEVLNLDESILKVAPGHDPDQRDCNVSTAKLTRTGFRYLYGLEQGIQEVRQMCSLLGEYERRGMRNA